MAISSAICNTFKGELLEGKHNFSSGSGHTFKIALFTSSASLGASTTDYSTSNEITNTSGSAYTAGGKALTNNGVTSSSGASTAFVDFANVSFTSATISAQAALIYNRSSSNTNAAIAVLDFGSVKTSTNGTFTIAFPTNDASSAILRLT